MSAHAIAGTHVILLGLDATEEAAKGLLGFAIEREDKSSGDRSWLRNSRGFEGGSDLADGGVLLSLKAPIQAFLWGDYTVEPGQVYTYRVVPMYGGSEHLRRGKPVALTVTTEREAESGHSVFFNRGVAGSQAYSRAFGEYRRWYRFERYGRESWREFIRPGDVPDRKAWDWLSRGLDSALLRFIAQAKNQRCALRAAVYECDHLPVIQAFVDALERGADVKIVYDASRKATGDGPGTETEDALRKVGLRKASSIERFAGMMIPRTKARIAHNKFIILLKDGHPTQVWTGSANFTAGGIFGQSNVGHIIRDAAIAEEYLKYWLVLATDPRRRTGSGRQGIMGLADWVVGECPDLVGEPHPDSVTVLFSPRTCLGMLDWFADRLATAKQSVHVTAAFGFSQQLAAKLVIDSTKDRGPHYLRYLLLEGKPSIMQSRSRKDKALEKGRPAPLDYYDLVTARQNCVAVGSLRPDVVGEGGGVGLRESLSGLDTHVEYLHTKYILLDPLTEDPTVITGSANFSGSSILHNDENMLVIRGNTRVADIYLTEFMRLFRHFRSRDQKRGVKLSGVDKERLEAATYLHSNDGWTREYYEVGTQKHSERLLFR